MNDTERDARTDSPQELANTEPAIQLAIDECKLKINEAFETLKSAVKRQMGTL